MTASIAAVKETACHISCDINSMSYIL